MNYSFLFILVCILSLGIPACKKKPTVPPVPTVPAIAAVSGDNEDEEEVAGPVLPLTPDNKTSAPRLCSGFEPIGFRAIVPKLNSRTTMENMIYQGKIGSFQLEVGNTTPTIRDLAKNSSCTLELIGVGGDGDSVYWLSGTRRALYRAESEKHEQLALVDLDTCKILWQSRLIFGKAMVTKENLQLGSDCGACEDNKNFSSVCECNSAEIWRLNSKCGISRARKASNALTKEQLKVQFRGKKKVKGAKADGAVLVN